MYLESRIHLPRTPYISDLKGLWAEDTEYGEERTVIWLRVKVPVLSVASSVSWTGQFQSTDFGEHVTITDPIGTCQQNLKLEGRDISLETWPRVSTPCKSLTSTFWPAIRFAAIDKSRVTTEGRPSGTKATRIETANVTVWAAFPL